MIYAVLTDLALCCTSSLHFTVQQDLLKNSGEATFWKPGTSQESQTCLYDYCQKESCKAMLSVTGSFFVDFIPPVTSELETGI